MPMMLPVWPLQLVFLNAPWCDGLQFVVGLFCLLALGEHIYFEYYGGTETEYPFVAERKPSVRT
jgi:hypothetical protein